MFHSGLMVSKSASRSGERLYGSVMYLLLYLLAGVGGSFASVASHPAANSAGSSGAIFGVCGALLAAQWRAGDRFPADILRPTRNSTLLFVGWALYASFSRAGIDYAAHIGRLAAIQLPDTSRNDAGLDTLLDLSDQRAQAFQLLDQGLRNNDSAAIATAGRQLKEIERRVKSKAR